MSATTSVVMLRGINIGPHNRIAMPDLRAALQEGGFADVRTYVQSGNVVLSSRLPPADLEQNVQSLIAERFGLSIPAVVRTPDELAEVVARDPFAGEQLTEKLYQVTFLAEHPPEELVNRLAGLAVGEERFVANGREWYTYHPAGVARSKLATGLSAKRPGLTATARNWTTVRTLLAMVEER